MSLSEFDIIGKYFSNIEFSRLSPRVGIGDDAAIIDVPNEMSLAIAVDTLVSDVHFFGNDPAEHIAWKAVAVNLSDMAAMGATPQWITLSLTLPEVNAQWLKDFRKGLLSILKKFNISLIGGDTTRGPLSITVQIQGLIKKGQYLSRSKARIGDTIFLSGCIGDAGAALQLKKGLITVAHSQEADYLLNRLRRPDPRVALGERLLGYANAAIDISDGVAADLSHILKSSSVGAKITLETLPLSSAYQNNIDPSMHWQLALSSGDDYELCFTVPDDKIGIIDQLSRDLKLPLTVIGHIEETNGLRCFFNEKLVHSQHKGYRHF